MTERHPAADMELKLLLQYYLLVLDGAAAHCRRQAVYSGSIK